MRFKFGDGLEYAAYRRFRDFVPIEAALGYREPLKSEIGSRPDGTSIELGRGLQDRHTPRTLEGSPHALGGAEAANLGDGLDRQGGLFEFAACGLDARLLDKFCRRHAGLGSQPGEIARAHRQMIGEDLHAEVFGWMGNDPSLQLANIMAALCISQQKRTELGSARLAAGRRPPSCRQ
jgi:hypothetical protein